KGQRDRWWPGTSPWRPDEEPFNDAWWLGVVSDFLAQDGRFESPMDVPSPCQFCGFPRANTECINARYCCLEGLARYLRASSKNGGPIFQDYQLAVTRPLLPPRREDIAVDDSWWSQQQW